MTGTTTEPRAPYRFHEGRELGAGGVGYVCEGWVWRSGVRRECAIKRLHPHKRDLMHYVRFEREAILGLHLTPGHDNLVTVQGYGFDDQGPYLLMERIHGTTAHHARKLIRGNWRVIWAIARATASAVSYLHDRGIVHRDVTARNILLDRSGAIKLTDLGLARAEDGTHTAGFYGTPIYSPPERLSAAPATPAADVYSLGAVLWHLVAGEPPYETGDRSVVRMRMARAPVRLPDATPPELAALLTRMIDLDWDNRPTLGQVRAIVDAHCPPADVQLASAIARIATNPSAAHSTDSDVSLRGTTREADESQRLIQIRERWRARMYRELPDLLTPGSSSHLGGISLALKRHVLLSVGRHFRAMILDHLPRPARSPHGTGPHLVVRPTGQWTDIPDASSSTGASVSDPGAAQATGAEPQRLIDRLRDLPEPFRSRAIAFLSDLVSNAESNPALFEALAAESLAELNGDEWPDEGFADALLRFVLAPESDSSAEAADESVERGDDAESEQWDQAEQQDALTALAGLHALTALADIDDETDGGGGKTPHSIARRHWGDGSASASEPSIRAKSEPEPSISAPRRATDTIPNGDGSASASEPSIRAKSEPEPSLAQLAPARRRRWVWLGIIAFAAALLTGYLALHRAFERSNVEPPGQEKTHQPAEPPGPSLLTTEPPLPAQQTPPPTAPAQPSRPPKDWRANRERLFQ